MTDNAEQAKEEAAEAASAAKKAAKSSGRAVREATEPVVEAVADGARDAGDKLEDAAHDAVRAAKKVDVSLLSRISGDTGVGFLALSVSLYAGAVAYTKFRQALSGGKQVVS